MNMRRCVTIACEGPDCNGGRSAAGREAEIINSLPVQNADMRDEAEKHARRSVSPKLTVTQHAPVGVTFLAQTFYQRFACEACGFERVYGNGSVL